MLGLLKYLPRPSLLGGLERTEDDAEESDYESASSDGAYDDCVDDIDEASEHPPDDDKKQKKKKKASSGQNSVYPPLSTIATGTEAVMSSDHLRNASFVDLDDTDDFDQTNIPLKSADSQQISFGQTKASTVCKNDLQTFCQRRKWKLPTYSHSKDGPGHALKFIAAVDVNGEIYNSPGKHNSKGEAEQAAAWAALTTLQQRHASQDLSPAEFTTPTKISSVQQLQHVVHSAKVNNRDGRKSTSSRNAVQGFGADIPDVPAPFEELTNMDKSHHKPAQLKGTSTVPVNTMKSGLQVRTGEGLTIDNPIDLSEDEQSVGSSPPISAASSPRDDTPSQSASRWHKQSWGPINNESVAIGRALLQKQNDSSSDYGAVPAGLDRKNDVNDIGAQFSRLQVSRDATVGKVASLANQSIGRNLGKQQWPPQTGHLCALGKLEFPTQVFPLLVRLQGRSLEDVFTVSDIEGLRDVPPSDVNEYLSDVNEYRSKAAQGRSTTNLSLPKEEINPSGLLYDCYVSRAGEIRFKIAENKQGSTTLLQRELGYDKVLRVFFESGNKQKPPNLNAYRAIAKAGIFVGSRLYQYFVHKPSDDISNDEDKRTLEGTVKCYFVCTDSQGEKDKLDPTFTRFEAIDDVRSLFMHINKCPSVAKYIARLQLCLSKTVTIEDMPWDKLVIKEMQDLRCDDPKATDALFTDGTGFISTNLIKLMPSSVFKGMKSEEFQGIDTHDDYPSLVQTRFFHGGAAHKGTLLARSDLPDNTIRYYKSMQKVESDPRRRRVSISSFELVSTSRYPRVARLSQDLILLLSIGGVPESIFLHVVEQAIKQVDMVLHDRKRACQEVLEWESNMAETTLLMIAAGIPLEEPGLRKNLMDLTRSKLQDITKGRVPLKDTFYLMGTADPTGTLEFDEVVIYRGDDNVCGTVLIYRAPGKHPGDIHRVNAIPCAALGKIVGRAKNIIFFSIKGNRPIPHEIAKGDLDGDLYWICKNQEVVAAFAAWKDRWYPGPVKHKPRKAIEAPAAFSPAELEEVLFEEYLNEQFFKSSVVGNASLRWLAHVDAFLHPDTSPEEKKIHEQEFLKYPDYIYEGVDIKSGVQLILPEEHKIIKGRPKEPYLLKKASTNVDGSADVVKGGRSILGKIYDLGQTAQAQWQHPSYDYEDFKVDPAFYVPKSDQHVEMWRTRVNKYCREMSQALNLKDKENYDPEEPDRICMSYKTLLYGAPSLKLSKKDRQKVLEEASAIYTVVYCKAEYDFRTYNNASVAFAWNIAGAALAFIYAEKQPGGNSIIWSPGPYKEVHKRSKATNSASIRRPLF